MSKSTRPPVDRSEPGDVGAAWQHHSASPSDDLPAACASIVLPVRLTKMVPE
jgi:hypothetical protein